MLRQKKTRVSEMSFSPITDFFHISLRLLKKCLDFASPPHPLHFKKRLLEGLDSVGFTGRKAVLSVPGKRLGDECCFEQPHVRSR
jgi:hypothetical protein